MNSFFTYLAPEAHHTFKPIFFLYILKIGPKFIRRLSSKKFFRLSPAVNETVDPSLPPPNALYELRVRRKKTTLSTMSYDF
jgi:hypothetical protein